MPIYAYKCTACGHAQDVLQKISDKPLTVCPECNQETYAKQVTAAGFQLKGSGWYVTDFRNNSGGGAKTAEVAPGVTAADKTGSENGSAGTATVSDSAATSNAGAANTPGSTTGGASTGTASTSSSSTAAAPASGSKSASGGSASTGSTA